MWLNNNNRKEPPFESSRSDWRCREGGQTIATDWFSVIVSCDVTSFVSLQCGNGELEPGEECDGDNIGEHTCQSISKDLP